jgi:hypothetical protein
MISGLVSGGRVMPPVRKLIQSKEGITVHTQSSIIKKSKM